MSWIFIALAAAAVGGGVSIVDKTLLQNYLRGHITLRLIIGIFEGVSGLAFVAGSAWSGGVANTESLWAFLSGTISGFGGLFLLYVLKSQEVSRAVPITQTSTVFAAVLAFIFLDEILTLQQWLAVVVTVTGAVLLSIQHDEEHRRLSLHRSFFALIAASIIMGAGFVVVKVPLDTLSVPLVHGLRSLGLSAVFLGASINSRESRDDLMLLIRRRSPGLALASFSQLVLVNGAFLLFLWALSIGSVGLVSALTSTRSLFVLLYSATLSLRFRDLLGERVTRGVVAIKLSAITLIVVGVVTITLS